MRCPWTYHVCIGRSCIGQVSNNCRPYTYAVPLAVKLTNSIDSNVMVYGVFLYFVFLYFICISAFLLPLLYFVVTESSTDTSSNATSAASTIDFSCDDIPKAFQRLTAEVYKLLKREDFYILRRAILQQKNAPNGIQFPDPFKQSIRTAQDLNALLDLLAESSYWNWVDLRLLEALIAPLHSEEAKVLVDKYKEAIFPKKLSEVIDKLPLPQQKEHKDAYTTKVGMKIQKEPNEITVRDLSEYCTILEAVIMDINEGSCVLEHLDKGCLEILWLIPTHCRFHAYKSALSNRHKFHDIHLQYLHIEHYPPIYNPFTIMPAILSTLLHLPKPITCKFSFIIMYYVCYHTLVYYALGNSKRYKSTHCIAM